VTGVRVRSYSSAGSFWPRRCAHNAPVQAVVITCIGACIMRQCGQLLSRASVAGCFGGTGATCVCVVPVRAVVIPCLHCGQLFCHRHNFGARPFMWFCQQHMAKVLNLQAAFGQGGVWAPCAIAGGCYWVHLLRATLPPQAQLACTSVRARPLVPMTLNTYCHVDWLALVTVLVAMGKHCRPRSKSLQMVQSGMIASTRARFQAARERTHVQQIAVAKNKI